MWNTSTQFEEKMEIFHRMRKIRESIGTSQGDFAKKLGITQSTYSNYEKGIRSIPDKIKIRISQFGISMDWFLTGKGPMFRTPTLEERESDTPLDHMTIGELESRRYLNWLKQDLMLETMRREKPPIREGYSPSGKIYRQEYEIPDKALMDELMHLQAEEHAFRAELERREMALVKEEEEAKQNKYPAPDDVEASESHEAEPEGYGPYQDLPLYEGVAAGEPLESFDSGEFKRVALSKLHGLPSDYFAIRLRGFSMVDVGINDGDVAIIRKSEHLVSGQIILVRHDGEYTLKRYLDGEDGGVRLAYEDGSGRVVEMLPGSWEMIGVVCFVGGWGGLCGVKCVLMQVT